MHKELRDFTLAVLDDDHGITEDAWYRLCDLLQASGELELLGEICRLSDACEGRYFIKEYQEKS